MEIVEQDTEETEEITNIFTFLLPKEEDSLQTLANFGLQFNKYIFQGWVKQPSACCGAASVAGAWNALHGYHRTHERAKNHIDVLNIYRDLTGEKVSKRSAAFERKLGTFDGLNDSFWNKFNEKTKQFGKEMGGKKETTITKKVMEKCIKFMIKNYVEQQRQSNIEENKVEETLDPLSFAPLHPLQCLLDLYKLEGVDLTVDATLVAAESKATEDEMKNESDDEVSLVLNYCYY